MPFSAQMLTRLPLLWSLRTFALAGLSPTTFALRRACLLSSLSVLCQSVIVSGQLPQGAVIHPTVPLLPNVTSSGRNYISSWNLLSVFQLSLHFRMDLQEPGSPSKAQQQFSEEQPGEEQLLKGF